MQTFTDDFPLNYVQNLQVIASESEEKFDFSPSNVAAGVKICKKLDILEEISDYKSETFTSYDLDLKQNPTGLHAPKFRILKKKTTVHPPSRLTIILDLV